VIAWVAQSATCPHKKNCATIPIALLEPNQKNTKARCCHKKRKKGEPDHGALKEPSLKDCATIAIMMYSSRKECDNN
jgi:hypothetical protein